jgi:peptidoglycan/xylan/chitin deacetylase (PgdA/CDA1 family)
MNAVRRFASSPAGMRLALAGRKGLQRADRLAARFAPKDRPGLLVLVFHCVFADQREAENGLMDPHERATAEGLGRLFDYFRNSGYRFVSAAEIDAGLLPDGHFAHLTFDDGFANNLRLLDLLPREEVHATIFPSANHVRNGTAFWWNVVYRQRRGRSGPGALAAEYAHLRSQTAEHVTSYLLDEFGPGCLEPAGEVDRPLTPSELQELGSSPWIEIGNHTLDHAILPACAEAEAEQQIRGAQEWLQQMLGEPPTVIAYPDGASTPAIEEMASRLGLRLGVSVVPKLNQLPLSSATRMAIGRFRVVFDHSLRSQLRAVRSSVQLAAAGRRLFLRRGVS